MAMKQPALDATKFWVCEQCGHVHESGLEGAPNEPPDECDYCGYDFFESLSDLLKNGWPGATQAEC